MLFNPRHPLPRTTLNIVAEMPCVQAWRLHTRSAYLRRGGSRCPQASRQPLHTHLGPQVSFMLHWVYTVSRGDCVRAVPCGTWRGGAFGGPRQGRGHVVRTGEDPDSLPWDSELHVAGRCPALRADTVLGLGRPLPLPLGTPITPRPQASLPGTPSHLLQPQDTFPLAPCLVH